MYDHRIRRVPAHCVCKITRDLQSGRVRCSIGHIELRRTVVDVVCLACAQLDRRDRRYDVRSFSRCFSVLVGHSCRVGDLLCLPLLRRSAMGIRHRKRLYALISCIAIGRDLCRHRGDIGFLRGLCHRKARGGRFVVIGRFDLIIARCQCKALCALFARQRIRQLQRDTAFTAIFKLRIICGDQRFCLAVNLIELVVRRRDARLHHRAVLIQHIQRRKHHRRLIPADAGKHGRERVALMRIRADHALGIAIAGAVIRRQRCRERIALFQRDLRGKLFRADLQNAGQLRIVRQRDLDLDLDRRGLDRCTRHFDRFVGVVDRHALYARSHGTDGIARRRGCTRHFPAVLVEEFVHGELDRRSAAAARNVKCALRSVTAERIAAPVRQGEDGLAGLGIVALDLEGDPIARLCYPFNGGTRTNFAPDICLQVFADLHRAG